MKRLILASGSPRRKQLLERVFLSFDISVSKVNESYDESLTASEVVEILAIRKAREVAKRFPAAVVLGADTIVSSGDEILGKPTDADQAKQMLSMLSGRTHTVYTGVAIVHSERTCRFYSKTDVIFHVLTEGEIEQYIASGEPFDKAGGYGIQGFGATLVKEIRGDYYTVVGLPVSETVRALKSFGITSKVSPKNE